jgi:predicted Fe-Mo cluster-binding NifX family protein
MVMKIAVAAKGKDIAEGIHGTFGRCPYFLIVEYDGEVKSYDAIENSALMRSGGVGIAAAQLVAEQGVDVVISGKIGPRAWDIFKQFNIDVYVAEGNIADALNALEEGILAKANGECPQGKTGCPELERF